MVWTPRVTVAAVIESDGKFLLVEETAANEAHTVFNQPAGHLEDGESLIEAVVRETLEETTYDFTAHAITGIYRWIAPNNDTYMRICFTGTVSEHHPELELDDGIVAARWLSVEELNKLEPRLRSPLVMLCIQDYLANKRYPLDLLIDVS